MPHGHYDDDECYNDCRGNDQRVEENAIILKIIIFQIIISNNLQSQRTSEDRYAYVSYNNPTYTLVLNLYNSFTCTKLMCTKKISVQTAKLFLLIIYDSSTWVCACCCESAPCWSWGAESGNRGQQVKAAWRNTALLEPSYLWQAYETWENERERKRVIMHVNVWMRQLKA